MEGQMNQMQLSMQELSERQMAQQQELVLYQGHPQHSQHHQHQEQQQYQQQMVAGKSPYGAQKKGGSGGTENRVGSQKSKKGGNAPQT
jgi:hypothetical protein